MIKRFWWVGAMGLILLSWVSVSLYRGMTKDSFCGTKHIATTKMPEKVASAQDWLTMGDFDYETGDCVGAIKDLNKAIDNNPNYAEAYNNRGFIKMRLRDYAGALSDLDKAIAIRPNYPHALINRGDIYNYYFNIDRKKAIADYDKVIAMGKTAIKSESVCGHRLMAKYNGFLPIVLWNTIWRNDDSGCLKLYFEK